MGNIFDVFAREESHIVVIIITIVLFIAWAVITIKAVIKKWREDV